MNYRSPPHVTSAYQEAIGMSPGEFDLAVAVLAHEAVYGFSPNREALADFFCVLKVNSTRLVQRGFLVAEGKPQRLSSTAKLRQTLGVAQPKSRAA